jgi:hypothetical protein
MNITVETTPDKTDRRIPINTANLNRAETVTIGAYVVDRLSHDTVIRLTARP